MTKMLAALVAALILTVAGTSADARTRHAISNEAVFSFDRHAISGGYDYGARIDVAVRRLERGPRRHHIKHRRIKDDGPHLARRHDIERGAHGVVASTGARASVSTVARSHFQCLIGKLEASGYRIDFMGGYASRGNSSAHPTGNALDINQIGRNVVTRRLPGNATALAQECGLVHGAIWSNPDQGHFEMARKYGYVFRHHRSRYATAL